MSVFPLYRITPLPGGYMGKILRVDLTTGSLRDENLPEEPVLKKFIGGQALASYILMKELPLNATPLGPENIVVMMTGPLTGNGFTPGGTKMTAVYLSPLTGITLGRGATSGYWATYLKAAGYDGIILSGASPKPVYLYIDEGQAELRDAARFWGLGTRETEDRLREVVGHRDAKILCIGHGEAWGALNNLNWRWWPTRHRPIARAWKGSSLGCRRTERVCILLNSLISGQRKPPGAFRPAVPKIFLRRVYPHCSSSAHLLQKK